MQNSLSLQPLESRHLLALNAAAFASAQTTDAAGANYWTTCGLANAAALNTFIGALFDPVNNGIGVNNTPWQACVAFFKVYTDEAEALSVTSLTAQQGLVQTQFTDFSNRATDHANCATSSALLVTDLPNAAAVIGTPLTIGDYPCSGVATGDVDTKNAIIQIVYSQNAAGTIETALAAAGL